MKEAPPRGRRGLKIALGLVVGGLFFYLVARGVDWDGVGATLANSEPLWLIPLVVALMAHFVFKSLRWRVLLSESVDVSRLFAFRLIMVGFFLNNVFPARLGEVGRLYLLTANRPDVSFSFGAATLVANKLFDLFAVMVFLLIASLTLPIPDTARWALALFSALCVATLAAVFAAAAWRNRELGRSREDRALLRLLGRFGSVGQTVYDVVLEFAHGLATLTSLRRFAHASAHTLGASLSLVIAVWSIFRMLGVAGSLLNACFVVGMIGAGAILPSAPTNAGTHHYFASLALTLPAAADPDVAFSFSLISHGVEAILSSLVGAVCMIGLDWRRARKEVASGEEESR
jgi:glycosyltransferase 2 family protein